MSSVWLLAAWLAAQTWPDRTPADRAVRGPQVWRGDADPQGLDDRRPRGGRSGLRGDHPPDRLPAAGVAACELGLAPESLDEYRTRIDANAKRNGRPERQARDQPDHQGPARRSARDGLGIPSRLRRPLARGERPGHRQPAALHLHPQRRGFDLCEGPAGLRRAGRGDQVLAPEHRRRPALEAAPTAGSSASTSSPSTCPTAGAPCSRPARSPSSSPTGRPTASGPTTSWSWPMPIATLDLAELARELPDQLRRRSPSCEVLSCEVVHQGKVQALETVVRTRRGPFSMTVIERRFRGERFDYEVKYTVESKRFDELVPGFPQELRQLPRVSRATSRGARPARRRESDVRSVARPSERSSAGRSRRRPSPDVAATCADIRAASAPPGGGSARRRRSRGREGSDRGCRAST